jgi:hypothetical protein
LLLSYDADYDNCDADENESYGIDFGASIGTTVPVHLASV